MFILYLTKKPHFFIYQKQYPALYNFSNKDGNSTLQIKAYFAENLSCKFNLAQHVRNKFYEMEAQVMAFD